MSTETVSYRKFITIHYNRYIIGTHRHDLRLFGKRTPYNVIRHDNDILRYIIDWIVKNEKNKRKFNFFSVNILISTVARWQRTYDEYVVRSTNAHTVTIRRRHHRLAEGTRVSYIICIRFRVCTPLRVYVYIYVIIIII